jgi:putative MFS transporter
MSTGLGRDDLPFLTVGERLDRLPVIAQHWKIFWLLAAGLYIDSTEVFLGGGVAAALLRDGWSTLELNAHFQFFTFLGLSIGAFGTGFMSDHYGRRLAFQFNLLLFGLASFAAAVAPSMTWLIFFRFVMGVGLGAEIVITYATLIEFVPARHRGRFISLFVIVGALTLFSGNLFAYLIIPALGWRPCFAFIGVASLFVWYARRVMPESPRWLAAVGRFDDAERIVRQIEGKYYKPCAPAIAGREVARPSASFFSLFRKGMLSRTLATASISIAFNIAVYSFTNWLPSFFVKQGFGISYSLGVTTFMTVGAPVGAIAALALSDRIGRKPLIIWGLVLGGIFGLLYPTATSTEVAVFYGFMINGFIYYLVAVGGAGYAAEVFPTEYRHRGTGFVGMTSRVAAGLCPYAVVPLYAWHGVTAVIGMVAAIFFVVSVIVWRWCVEPKGLSLESVPNS